MRRNDFDVTDKIRTTDPSEVVHEVMRLYLGLYPSGKSGPMRRAFEDVTLLYRGRHPDYYPCDTEYHDIQHVLDVTLAMARLLDGYERGRRGEAALPADFFSLGVITALFHDCGYLRRRHDHRHRFGGEYTLTHVSRGSHFLREYLPHIGMKRYAAAAAQLVHFTGYERQPDTIRLSDPLLRRVGEILGTADIIAQMSDRCYLEKCRDRLYPEFVLGGLARRKLPDGQTVTVYESGNDLVRKTPGFYATASKRLDQQLHGAYHYAEKHFGSQRNPYLEQMDKNINYAEVMAEVMTDSSPGGLLRRCPPKTVQSDLRP
ncbi:MAG TPA: HD domain-containing protein [Gammaproteobacteria bacterium]|nr:HD domain-containing protein [Gammaproteobacteria bacterium]